MKKKNVLLLAIAAVSFFWFSSAGGKEVSSKSAKKADQITYAISASPVGKFNPLIADTQYDEYVNGLVYASLLRLNAKIELEPALAEKYEVSKDSTVITFMLRYVFDANKAKEYLKKAGYEDTNGDGFVDKNGKNLQLTLTVPKGDKIREQTGSVIQADLKKIGIDIVLEPMDFNATMQTMNLNCT